MSLADKKGGRNVLNVFNNLGFSRNAGIRNIWHILLLATIIGIMVYGVYLAFAANGGTAHTYPVYGWTTNGSINLACNILVQDVNIGINNMTNVSLWTNITGTWRVNQSLANTTGTGTTLFNNTNVIFNLSGLDNLTTIGQSIGWYCSVNASETGSTYNTSNASFRAFGIDAVQPKLFNVSPGNNTFTNNIANFFFSTNVTEHNLVMSKNVSVWYRRSGTTSWKSNITLCTNNIGVGGTGKNSSAQPETFGTAAFGNESSTALNTPAGTPNLNCSINVTLSSILGGITHGWVVEFMWNSTDYSNLTGTNGTDNGGTPSASAMTFTIDQRNPWINATNGPGNGQNVSGTFVLNYTVSDEYAIGSVSYWWNNISGKGPATLMTNIPTTNFYYANVSTTDFVNGTLNLTINVTDAAGNVNLSYINVTVFVDNSAPITSIISPASNTTGSANISGSFLLNVSVNDFTNSSGIKSVQWYWINSSGYGPYNALSNGTAATAAASNGNNGYFNATVDTSTFAQGLTNITVNASDWAGNSNLTNFTIRVDSIAPALVVLAPQSMLTVLVNVSSPSGMFTLNVSVNDSGSRIKSVQWYWINSSGQGAPDYMSNVSAVATNESTSGQYNASNISANTYKVGQLVNITINATDWAGNSNLTNVTLNISADGTYPSLFSPYPSNRTYVTAVTAQVFSINLTETNFVPELTNATLFYRLKGAGLTSWTAFRNLSCSGTSPNFFCNRSIDLNNDLSVVHGNIVEFMFNVTDQANFTSANTSLEVTIDIRKPTINASNTVANTGSNVSGTFVLNYTVGDDTNVTNVSYWWVNGSAGPASLMTNNPGTNYWYANVSTSAFINGTLLFTVNVTDAAGNYNASYINTTIIIDNALPNILALNLSSNMNDTIINSFSAVINASSFVRLNISVNDSTNSSGVKAVTWYWSNASGTGPASAMTNATPTSGRASNLNNESFNATVDVSAFADGLFNITVNASDWANNLQNVNITVLVDRTAPNISTAINVVNGTLVANGSIILNISVNDTTSRIRAVTWFWANASGAGPANVMSEVTYSLNSNISIGYYNATITTSRFANGAVSISANVTDWAGNTKLINVTNLTIDNTGPVLLNWTYSERNRIINMTFNATVDATTVNLTAINITTASTLTTITDLRGLGGASVTSVNSTLIMITLLDWQDTAVTNLRGNSVVLNVSLAPAFVQNIAGVGNSPTTMSITQYNSGYWYTYPARPSLLQAGQLNNLFLPTTSDLNSFGITSAGSQTYNISYVLDTSCALSPNYNIVYYNVDGTSSGWKAYVNGSWATSNLQYVNNTNDKPYKINMTTADRCEIAK
ncbi:hypothetical protein HYY72_02575 [Candidatus Woesearchaeota archaeon]|nr:hypothetical protein [Candidatus Woesearchaeota archaeon]